MKTTLITVLGLMLALSSCQEEDAVSNFGKTARSSRDRPDDFTDHPGGLPYPEIIEQYYPADLTYYQGCLAWRIEWPDYPEDADSEMIPTFFATSTGNLNSLNYLYHSNPANKDKATFSLYTDHKIEAATDVSELWDWTGIGAEAVYFRKISKTPAQIEAWVTNRPSNFEKNWPYGESIETEIGYQAGDFILFQLPGQSPVRYGGIRVVSTAPRIIEVYLPVPK